jgi:hypothetical protein
VTLSNDIVLNILKKQFVCGFKNITGEPYAGKSGKHDPDSPAVLTTNGAGPHNVQIFMLSSDGTGTALLAGLLVPRRPRLRNAVRHGSEPHLAERERIFGEEANALPAGKPAEHPCALAGDAPAQPLAKL